MKKKQFLLIGVILFILLLGGSYLLYNKLLQKEAPETLNTEVQNSTEDAEDTNDTNEKESTSAKDETSENGTEGEQEDEDNPKIQAPNFIVYDEEGNEVNLTDFFGKPIVVNFWASWCGPCKSEMPEFDKKYAEYGEDITFLMVNMTDGSRETVETAKEYVKEGGFSFPVYYDTEINAAMVYGVYSLPTTYFIDKDGIIVAQAKGALDAETLQKGIDMIHTKKE